VPCDSHGILHPLSTLTWVNYEQLSKPLNFDKTQVVYVTKQSTAVTGGENEEKDFLGKDVEVYDGAQWVKVNSTKTATQFDFCCTQWGLVFG
jgi:hypothetical protein